MVVVCSGCQNEFYLSGKARDLCFRCFPYPGLPEFTQVISKYEELRSFRKTSLHYNVPKSVIEAYVHNFGTPQVCTSRPNYSTVVLDMDWMDGWLLGDGSLYIGRGSKNACASHGSSKYGYCEYIVTQWKNQGLTCGSIYKQVQTSRNSTIFHVHSHNHPVLTEQYNRWYILGRKHIPCGVSISPVSLREWYLGDGTLVGGEFPTLVMGGVVESEVDMMHEKLLEIFGVGVSKYEIHRSQPLRSGVEYQRLWNLHFTRRVASAFFSYIGPCPVPCYSYRWPQKEVQARVSFG